eukprot:gene7659-381_t
MPMGRAPRHVVFCEAMACYRTVSRKKAMQMIPVGYGHSKLVEHPWGEKAHYTDSLQDLIDHQVSQHEGKEDDPSTPLLLFLHPLVGSAHVFEGYWKSLQENRPEWRLVAVDWPPFGFTGPRKGTLHDMNLVQDGDYSMQRITDWVHELMLQEISDYKNRTYDDRSGSTAKRHSI